MKTCSKCKITKENIKFGDDAGAKDGLYSSCLLCEKIRNKGRSHILARRFMAYKSRAKKKGIAFKLSLERFKEITSRECYYCNGFSDDLDKFCGIDRIDSNKGYIKNNVMPCCEICNRMKGILGFQQFLDKIKDVFKNIWEPGKRIDKII